MGLKISRILHAGYVFECSETQIAFDPIFENPFSRNCYAFPNVQFDVEKIQNLKFAAVFISHFHDDHCSFESLDLLDRQTPIYAFCVFEELFLLIKELDFVNIYPLELGVGVHVGPFEITPHRALDADVDSIFQIKADNLNVLNVVDSWIDSFKIAELAKLAPWDMVLWPFQTMREIEVIAPSRAEPAPSELPCEWVEQLKILKPRYIVPSSCQFIQESWSWYNHAFFPISYRQFEHEIGLALPGSRVVRMNPSVAIALDKNSLEFSNSLDWIRPVGEQNVDYEYIADYKPPTTAEISQHFAPLESWQIEKVFSYCRSVLIEKYNSMESPLDEYFKKIRFWQLSLFDHTGVVTNLYYKVCGGNIELLTEIDNPISWLTEVPISKLYAALELGESLASMYIRINDRVFEQELESEIASADIVEDPLIRCLFSGVFGAYQIAQLKRLKT